MHTTAASGRARVRNLAKRIGDPFVQCRTAAARLGGAAATVRRRGPARAGDGRGGNPVAAPGAHEVARWRRDLLEIEATVPT
jgi:hypothetical protein